MPRNTLRTLARLFFGGMTALAAVLPSGRASASFTIVPPPAVAEASAAYRYANMSDVEAYAELDKRKVPYKKADPISGVLAPVRLSGKLHGVWIHSSIPESQRATSVYEVMDARLLLALDDFAKILERHDIEEVVHYSLYRPNVPREEHDVKAPASLPALPAAGKPAPGSPAATGAKGPASPTAIGVKAPASATVVGAKAPASAAVVGAKAPAGNTKSAPAGGKPGPQPKTTGSPGTAAGKAGVATGVKGNKPAPGKAPAVPAKPQAPKSQLPAAPAKALPQLPAKGIPAVHGLKHKKVAAVKTAPAARARGATPVKGSAVATAARAGGKPAGAKVQVGAAGAKNPAVAASGAKAPRAPVSRQTWASPGTRHPAGLAIDVALLKKRDGQWISVTSDFHGKIGAKTCGDGVPTASTPEARELRSVVCESGDLGVFTYVLTPNYNAAHFDHFHMEIRPDVKWFLYH